MTGRTRGFTLVELIIVIATIGILATITLIGLNRYQADTRDARRAASATVIAEALEKYYDQNGEYPSCGAVTDGAAVVNTNTLKGIDTSTLVAPQAPSDQTNSIECQTLTTNGTDIFEYSGDGSTDCNGSSACLQYTLKYKEESTGTIKTITSRHSTSIATANAPTLTTTDINFNDIDFSWTPVQNASSYTLQQSSSAGFGSYTSFTIAAGTTTKTVTGLSGGTGYFFRVRADAANSTFTSWSATLPVTTQSLATPSATAVVNSDTQITVSWGSIFGAANYNLEYSTSSTFASGVTPINGIAGLSQAVTGLTVGTPYYFHVKAVNGINISNWSPTVSGTPAVPAPTSLTATTNSNTQITASWSTVSAATTYTLHYSTSSVFSSYSTSTITAPTTTKAVTGLTPGTRYYFRVYANVGAVPSVASPTANATTTISNPTGVSVSASNQGVRNFGDSYWAAWDASDSQSGSWYYVQGVASASCAAGTTPMYLFSGAYNSFSGSYAWTQWGSYQPYNVGFMVGLWSGYGARFTANVYCAGNTINSGVTSASGCIWYSGATSPCNW